MWKKKLSLLHKNVNISSHRIDNGSFSVHMCCLVHSSGSTKERSGAPLKKSVKSHEDQEVPSNQPSVYSKKHQKKLTLMSQQSYGR